ncbi:hypothetical protein [Hymenobacter tenuis]
MSEQKKPSFGSKKPTFGDKVLESITDRLEPVVPEPTTMGPAPSTAENEPTWVPYSTAVTQATYLALKRAEYWVPGFSMKEAAETALNQYLATLEGADRPIPGEERLLANNKKLQGYQPPQ